MDSLRWILLVIGLLVVAGVFVYGWLQEQRRRDPAARGRSRSESGEPDFDVALQELDSLIQDERQEPVADERAVPPEPASVAEPRPEPTVEPEPAPKAKPRPRFRRERKPEPERQDAQGPGEKIVIINVTAGEDHLFRGPALAAALEQAGLRHGDHDIYHRILDTRTGPVALFSAANIVEPGTFDLQHLDELDTPGVAFFMQLPGPFDGLAAFEQMLEAARRLADQLGGHLLDARRCDLTNQAIEHIREDLREYRRLAHLAARQAR